MFVFIAVPDTGLVAILVVVAVLYAIGSIFLQRKLTNPKRMREIQRTINEHSKKLNELVKSGATKEEISARQSQIMPLLSESMKSQMKPMFVVLPLFIVLYYFLVPGIINAMGAAKGTITFIMPDLSYQYFFFLVEVIIGMAASITVMVYDRKTAKKEALIASS